MTHTHKMTLCKCGKSIRLNQITGLCRECYVKELNSTREIKRNHNNDSRLSVNCVTCGKPIAPCKTNTCHECFTNNQKTKYFCKCGKQIRKHNKTCFDCRYLNKKVNPAKPPKSLKDSHHKNKHCPKCNRLTYKDGLCSTCLYLERAKKVSETTHIIPTVRRTNDRISKNYKPSACPNSPSGFHHWDISMANIGTCRYCSVVQDMDIKPKRINPMGRRNLV